jgi:hypothetical protein
MFLSPNSTTRGSVYVFCNTPMGSAFNSMQRSDIRVTSNLVVHGRFGVPEAGHVFTAFG